jgi:hypothetical protein
VRSRNDDLDGCDLPPDSGVYSHDPSTSNGSCVSAKKKTRRTMSDEHKQAIADARRQNQAVRDYLKALTTAKPAG